ncbi:hypothetical protein HK105_200416 [Polyrhizophydium stewartii]|uniref:Velvet domain-containing protein n=1 Tax=Polyrhizophydium stewartii TaxID=2732419 RepID=A0ABR4NLC6_9FUNG
MCHVSLVAADPEAGARDFGDRSVALNTRAKVSLRARSLRAAGAGKGAFAAGSPELLYQSIIGTTIRAPELLTDLDGSSGLFFVFSDLSVRVHGHYRLKGEQPRSDVVTTVYTDPFVMYPPKNYPGLTESTRLSKWFSYQGATMSVRRYMVDSQAK